MKAKYTPAEAQIRLTRSEVITVMKALDVLRYSEESRSMSGSMLLDLAALSTTWLCMCQDMNSPHAEERCSAHNYRLAQEEISAVKPSPEEALNITWEEALT